MSQMGREHAFVKLIGTSASSMEQTITPNTLFGYNVMWGKPKKTKQTIVEELSADSISMHFSMSYEQVNSE